MSLGMNCDVILLSSSSSFLSSIDGMCVVTLRATF